VTRLAELDTPCPVVDRARAAACSAAALAALAAAGAFAQATPLFEAHSKRQGSVMDISVREIERRPRASVLAIEIRNVGSSVGSSFFLLCSVRKLAQARGASSYVVKLEETPQRGQMLIGFLQSAAEPPGDADPAFASAPAGRAQVIELEQFAPICDAKPPAR
jgi:hypothetical protein